MDWNWKNSAIPFKNLNFEINPLVKKVIQVDITKSFLFVIQSWVSSVASISQFLKMFSTLKKAC